MREALLRLAERREVLVARSADQRRSLARSVDAWRRPLALADRGVSAVNYVRSHHVLTIGALLLPGGIQTGRVGKWLRRGLAAWGLVSRFGGRRRRA